MIVIGITGGVGSGKSAILQAIKERYNCHILLADDAAKMLEKKGEVCYGPLIELLGEDILGEDGEIVPAQMAMKIFNDEDMLAKVNDIIHPAVKQYILNEIKEYKDDNVVDYFFLEAALLIECGYKAIVDEMWFVFVDKNVRRDRLKNSRGYNDTKIDSIMNSQLSDEEYIKNSDFVIDNNLDIDNAMNMIEAHLFKISE